MEQTHQRLFYKFREELKTLCRKPDGSFHATVSVQKLLELECRYAEAETAMYDALSAEFQSSIYQPGEPEPDIERDRR